MSGYYISELYPKIEIHTLSDASQEAIAAVSFLNVA